MSEVKGGHVIRWEFDDGVISPTVWCSAPPEDDCHLVSDCDCEQFTIERDERGAFHTVEVYDEKEGGSLERHDMQPEQVCNVEDWLENSDIEELYDGTFVIAETQIEPEWMGDYLAWKPAEATA